MCIEKEARSTLYVGDDERSNEAFLSTLVMVALVRKPSRSRHACAGHNFRRTGHIEGRRCWNELQAR
jgi:hypothetical protein